MIANHKAAFLRVDTPDLYHLSSHPDVSILNHAYIHITKATVAKIHRIRLIVFLIVSNKEASIVGSSVPIILIQSTYSVSQNHCANVVEHRANGIKIQPNIIMSFFIDWIL